MTKIKKWLLLGILIAISLLLLFSSGCGGEKKIKCDLDSDCPDSAAKCKYYSCEEGYCALNSEDFCCGNLRCEEGENPCQCPQDCKPACNGTVMLKNSAGKSLPSQYLKKMCSPDNECIISIDPKLQKQVEQFNELSGPSFKFNIYTRYSSPFDKQSSVFELEFELKSIDTNKIQQPVLIKQIRIMEGTNLVANSDVNLQFGYVADKAVEQLEMSYSLSQPEETKSLQVNVEYEYVPLSKQGSEYVPQQQIRTTYRYPITQKVTLLDPELAK